MAGSVVIEVIWAKPLILITVASVNQKINKKGEYYYVFTAMFVIHVFTCLFSGQVLLLSLKVMRPSFPRLPMTSLLPHIRAALPKLLCECNARSTR